MAVEKRIGARGRRRDRTTGKIVSEWRVVYIVDTDAETVLQWAVEGDVPDEMIVQPKRLSTRQPLGEAVTIRRADPDTSRDLSAHGLGLVEAAITLPDGATRTEFIYDVGFAGRVTKRAAR